MVSALMNISRSSKSVNLIKLAIFPPKFSKRGDANDKRDRAIDKNSNRIKRAAVLATDSVLQAHAFTSGDLFGKICVAI